MNKNPYYNNPDLYLKYQLDYKGKLRSDLIVNSILKTKINQYSISNWPFKNQTQDELMRCLFYYGKVMVLKHKLLGLIFLPFSSSINYLTKININLATLSIIGDYNDEINKSKYIANDNKKQMPFIFINSIQTAPYKELKQVFDDIKATYNTINANRINKVKTSILFTPNGNAAWKQLYKLFTTPDCSPFHVIETSKNKNAITPNDYNNLMTGGSNDLYNSLNQEAENNIQIAKIESGAVHNLTMSKTSAQETDNQTQNQKIETIENLKNELKSLRNSFKHINKLFNTQLSIDFTDKTKSWVDEIIDEANPEQKQNLDEAAKNNDLNKFIKWFKNVFTKNNEKNNLEKETETGEINNAD